MRFFNDSTVNKNYLAMNSNLTTEQIDLLYSIESLDKDNLAAHSKLTVEQFMRFFNDEDFDKDYLAMNSNLTTEQIDLLNDDAYGVDKDRSRPILKTNCGTVQAIL